MERALATQGEYEPSSQNVEDGFTGRIQKSAVTFEDILRTLHHASWQEKILDNPTLDAHT